MREIPLTSPTGKELKFRLEELRKRWSDMIFMTVQRGENTINDGGRIYLSDIPTVEASRVFCRRSLHSSVACPIVREIYLNGDKSEVQGIKLVGDTGTRSCSECNGPGRFRNRGGKDRFSSLKNSR